MLAVGTKAPSIDGLAVVRGVCGPIAWDELHGGRPLALFFDCVGTYAQRLDYLLALDERADELHRHNANVAAVCANTPDEIQDWIAQLAEPGEYALPLVVDAVGELARLYGLATPPAGDLTAWALIDRQGSIRETGASALAGAIDIDWVLRGLEQLSES